MAVNSVRSSNWIDKYRTQLPQINNNSGGNANSTPAVSPNQNIIQNQESSSWLDKYRNGNWQNTQVKTPEVQLLAFPFTGDTTYKASKEHSALTGALPLIRTDKDIQASIDETASSISQLEKQVASYKGQLAEAQGDLQLHAGYDDEAEYKARLDALTKESDYYNKKLAEARDSLNSYNSELAWYKYGSLRNNPDFAEYSQYKSTANGTEAKLNPLSGMYTSTGYDDITYDYINGDENARYMQKVNDINSNTSFLGVDESYLSQMDEDEIGIFNYLYATQGKDKAYEFVNYIANDLTYRQRKNSEAQWAQYAQEHPVQSSAFSTLTSPLKSLSYLGQAADYIADGQLDENAAYNRFSYANSAMRGAVAQKIEDSGKWGKVGSFLYQTGMSMGDFLLNSGITGGNEALSLALMGTGAAADSVIEAKDRGLSDDQSFLLGTIAGAAEIITEKVSIEALFKSDLTGMKYLLKNVLSEGSEEVGSDLINLIADGLIAGNESQLKVSIMMYEMQGMSESQAFVEAMKDLAIDTGLDFLGGALSGGVMAIPGTAMTWNDSKANTQTNTRQNVDISPVEAVPQGNKVNISTGNETIDALLNGWDTAETGAATKTLPKISLEDFANSSSPIWNNVSYGDVKTQSSITQEVHQQMVNDGRVVQIPDSTVEQVSEAYPDLRKMKKSERTPILKQKMNELKSTVRRFLNGIKGSSYEFEVNGNILEARLYDTGVREVMEKINQHKASMLLHSDEVFANAQYLYSTEDYENNPSIFRWNYFYTPVQIGNEIVGVRIAVRDMLRGTDFTPESQIYNWNIKENTPLDGGSRGHMAASSGASSGVFPDAALGGAGHTQNSSSSYGTSSAASFSNTNISQNDISVKNDSSTQGSQNMSDGLGAADAQSTYNDWVNNAEEFHPQGEKAVRKASLPTENLQGQRTMKTGATVIEAEVTPDNRVPVVENEYVNGNLAYEPQVDADLAKKAEDKLKYDGWNKALNDWTADVKAGKVNADLVAMGATLLNNAGNGNADAKLYADLVVNYAELLHNAGQALQASRILKMLTPEGKLYAIQRTINNLNDLIGDKGYNIEVPQELYDAYNNAQTDEARDEALDKIIDSVAEQKPTTRDELWNAWRYTAMLGNLKTQVRNLGGNIVMNMMRSTKNTVQAATEAAVKLLNKDYERQASLRVGREWMAAAKNDLKNVQDALEGNIKYRDSTSPDAIMHEVNERAAVFKINGTWGTRADSNFASKTARKAADVGMAALEAYRKATNWAMNNGYFGDLAFLNHNYTRQLAGYLKANGVEVQQFVEGNVDPALLDRARAYAIKEAQEATFHDSNAFSDMISKLKVKDAPADASLSEKAATTASKVLVEGVLPFKKTPANVLVRAEQYSPLGLVNTLIDLIQTKDGTKSAGDVINAFSKALTGTGLSMLGYMLSQLGWLRGTSDEDDESIDALMNLQDFSLHIPGKGTFTLDWVSPASLPFFAGVVAHEIHEDSDLSMAELWSVATSFADPLMELSMVSGLQDLLGNVKYAEGSGVLQLAVSMGLSYMYQAVPTLFGQIERIGEENRMTTYTDPDNKWLNEDMQYQLGKLSQKVPGWDYQQTEYLDEFGNTESSGSVWERILENLGSPGYWNPSHEGEAVHDYLQTIHDETGTDYYPGATPPSSFSSSGTKYTLSQADKEQYQKTQGETYIDGVAILMDAVERGKMSYDEQADILSDIKSYAAGMAKEEFMRSQGVDYSASSNTWSKAMDAYREADISVVSYLEYDAMISNMKYKEGEKQKEVVKIIDSLSITEKQKDYLYCLSYEESTLNKTPWHSSGSKSSSFWDLLG